ncbi:toll-like receptor 2 [Coccinella septempunctata]|uniref:toll-like receptor 2 n=1 Tax=Coccinella septempunctata TaxID=41139 RepID=UPI001D097E96|nr:toll-like receptor 2 [Coccinella septempunctata]
MMPTLLFLLMGFQIASSMEICTSHFCPPILEKQKITVERELPVKLVGLDNTTGCICTEIPNVYTLCYNAEDKTTPCTRFPKTMKLHNDVLLLKSTYITELSYGDLYNMAHLKDLKIDSNQKLRHVDPFVFQNMTNLTVLSFIFNPQLTTLHPDTFQGLINLKELNLVKNGFHSIKILTVALKPSILPNLTKLGLNENVFRNVSEDDFEPMQGSNVEELNLILCAIKHIHSRSLGPLEKLQALRLGDNRFDVSELTNLLVDTLSMGADLKLLDLFSSGFRGSMPISVLEVIGRSNISYLILSRNQFDVIDNELFPIHMPNLNILDLSDVSAQQIHDQAFLHLPNLRTLILGKNRLSFFAASNHLPNLTYLDLRSNTDTDGWEFFLTKSEFRRMNLEYLDLQYTRLLLLSKTDFGYMPNLRILNLKNCSVVRIEDYTFKGLTSLKVMNLENNRFIKMWMSPRFEFDIFGGLGHLEVVLLGGNDITTMRSPTKRFLLKYLENIKHLGLNRNSLQTISSEDFASFTKLEILDISENHILSWDYRIFPHVKLRKFYGSLNKISYLSDAMLADFDSLESIKLDFNSFMCDCATKDKMSSNKTALKKFSRLIKDQDLFCVRPNINQTLTDFVQKIVDSSLGCDPGINILLIAIPTSTFLVVVVILGVLGYLYRWHIRYWAFLVRLYLTRKGKIRKTTKKGYTNFKFDAFVSYCNKDQNFVIRLVKMLETQEPFLRLCVYERDFQIGSVISESVLEYITNSRKTVLIVSDAYAKSYWCNWETQIAEHHRLFFENPNGDCVDESIVLIKLGKINEAHLNPTLKYLLKTRIYLEWHADAQRENVFWQKLKQFLTPPTNDNVEMTNL